MKAAKRKKDKMENFVDDEDRLYRKRVKLVEEELRTKDNEICLSDYATKVDGTNFKLGRLKKGHKNCSDGRDSKKERKSGKKSTVQHLQAALESAEEENLLSHEDNSHGRLLESNGNKYIVSLCSEQSPDKKTEKEDRNEKKTKRRNDCSGKTLKGRVDDKEDGFLFDKRHVLNEGNENIKRKKRKSNEKIVQLDEVMSDPICESKVVAKDKKRKSKKPKLKNNGDEPGQGNDVKRNFQSSNCADEKDSRKGKKKKNNERNGKQVSEKERKTHVHPAVDYLLTWYNDRNNWSFKKVRQVWLLHNIFDQEQICDENFCILLKYLEGLKGAAKTKTIKMAENRLDIAAGTAENQAMVENRVRQVLQMLSE